MQTFTIPAAPPIQALPHSRTINPFLLAVAGEWVVYPDGRLRPGWRVHRMASGINGVGESIARDRRKTYLKVVESATLRNQKVLPPDQGPAWLGGGYLVGETGFNPDQRAEATIWRLRWETIAPGPSGRVEIDYDMLDAYVAWWQEQGLVPAEPPKHQIDDRIADLERRLGVERVKDPMGLGPRAKRLAADLALWQRAAGEEPAAPFLPAPAPAAPAPQPVMPKRAPKPAKPAPAAIDLSADPPAPDDAGMEA